MSDKNLENNSGLSYGILDGMVGLELRKAQSLASQTFTELFQGKILTGHYTILVLIADNPGQSQSRIAEAAGLDRSSLVPILKQFDKDGLIERVSARHDRRSKIMKITTKGNRLIEKYTADIEKLENDVKAGLGAENHQHLVDLLLQFQDFLQKGLNKIIKL